MLALTQGLMSLGSGGGAGGSFNDYAAALSPLAWWRLDSNAASGQPMVDSSGNGYNGTLFGGAFTASIAGGAGLGGGRSGPAGTGPNSAPLRLGTATTDAWSISAFVDITSLVSTNSYICTRGANEHAVIYGFVAGTFEIFSPSATGTPRTGSQMTTTTTGLNHVVYTYNNGDYRGFLNGTQVFSTTRSISFPSTTGEWRLANSGAGNELVGPLLDLQLYNRALNPAEVAELWARRNNA